MYFLIIVIVAFLLYAVFKRRTLVKQVELFNKLLYVEKSPEKYIDEINKILLKVQSDNERNINFIQKTTGLFYAGRFEEVINILKNEVKKIPPNWQHIYYHNLILSLYFNGNIEEGNNVFCEADEILKIYAKKEYNKAAIDLIYAISDFYNGKGIIRKDFFINLRETGRNDYRIAIAYYFLSKINENEGNIEESELNLEKAQIYGQGSFIEG